MTSSLRLRTTVLVCAAALTASALLVACGGGGGGGSASGTSFSGTIASGAAYPLGTTITAYDKNGFVVGSATQTTDDTGSYSYVIPAGAQAPFVFAASAPGLDTLYSFSATGAAGTVNITPITNLIAARLSPTGNPENLSANASQITTAAVTAQTQAVIDVLAPAAAAVGVTLTNPFSTVFSANGTGQDQLLDALKIKITPSSGGANADIAVISTAAVPIVIPTFPASASTTASIPPLQQNGVTVVTGTIAANTIVASGTAVKVKDLVSRMQSCYALPLADRIVANGTTAADITGAACKTLFLGDDPVNYKNNGFPVGKSAHWSGIFHAGAQGALFDYAKYEFTLPNGDIVISFRSRSSDGGNVKYSNAVTRLVGDTPNQALKIIGNQYNYDADIGPQVHQRTIVNDTSYNYKSTGYRMYVENKQIDGSPAFDRVEVSSPATPTHPNGIKFTLKPTSGYSFLVVVASNGQLTASGSVMLNLKATGPNPVSEDAIITKAPKQWAWAPRADWSDANIAAIAAQTTWTFKYFNAGNTTTTADTTETRRTTARAPTLAELESYKFPRYTDTFLAQAKARSEINNRWTYIYDAPGLADIRADGDLPAWEVPTGAQAPTEIVVFGRAPDVNNVAWSGNGFNDTATFSASARKTIVSCSRQSNADLHCGSDAVMGTPTNYPTGTRVTYTGLQAYGPNNMRASVGMDLYKVSLIQ